MLQSVSAAITASSATRPTGSGILENQLSKYEVQLADWCACPSGKTPDGKKKIADLRNKVDAIKVQLQQIETVRTRRKDLESAAAAQAGASSPTGPSPQAGPAATVSATGGLIDVTV
jgi:hypothetical protein